MIIGYARVSTTEQNLDLQRDGLNPTGCEKIIEDAVSGGKVPAAPAGDDPQQAFAAFQDADSPDVMRQAVGQFPIRARPYFIAAIERAVAEQVPSTQQPTIRQRLTRLQQLAAEPAARSNHASSRTNSDR
jgi:hypothetical protein